jgi:CDP-2,3-bis-(O-geranylgeranyl)-sn-glycerol synthase
MYLILQGFWFILPAMWSNMAPLWAKKMPFLERFDRPIDGNKKLNNKPILGRNKTYRGFIAGVGFAVCIGFIQWAVSETFTPFNNLEFTPLGFWQYILLSTLLGFGALAGDAVESFFKRRLEIPSGKSWVPLDQIDYVIGACMFAAPVVILSPAQYLVASLVGALLHPAATIVGWKLGLKDAPI